MDSGNAATALLCDVLRLAGFRISGLEGLATLRAGIFGLLVCRPTSKFSALEKTQFLDDALK
jgi:hypothetical protein